jgi:penicillin-binding protein 1A
VLYQHTPTTTDAVKPAIATDVAEVLKATVERGTGTRARLEDKTVLGITGTAQGFTDAWFIGSVDNLTAAIWLGDPINSTSIRQIPNQRGTGGWLPALLWAQIMNTPPDIDTENSLQTEG